MDIKQSYVMTIARAKLSLYAQRLLIKCVQTGQAPLENIPLSRINAPLNVDTHDIEIKVPMREICENNTHYDYVLKAAQELTKQNFTYITTKGWVTTAWVMKATHEKGTGNIKLLIDQEFYKCLYDFSKGYSRYDLERALNFKRASTIRLYTLMNAQKHPIKFSIENLKKITGTEEQYKKTNDFIRKVINPAKEETKKQPNGNYWEYMPVKTGQKITHLILIPKARASEAQQNASIAGLRQWLSEDYMKLLIHHAGFTTWQISCHKKLLEKLTKKLNGMEILLSIVQRARRKRPANLQGYIINALKNEIL